MIQKELKDYKFGFAEDIKVLRVWETRKQKYIELDKVRMLSLMRFMIRVLQRLSVHKRHAKLVK